MNLNLYHRFPTREVSVGGIQLGGSNPIRIQSMTTADTMDTKAVVEETLDLYHAGCEIVRITAPGVKDAENLKNIKSELLKRDCPIPLVADIHFSPRAALIAIEHVEKVRINPGNYTDKKLKDVSEYSQAQYEDDLGKAEESFRPLVIRARELNKSLRIGVNHGSLSDRILNRFGDTPEGMVESAVEFVKMAEKQNFHSLIISMKASIPEVMIMAYRMLVRRFMKEGMNYPLHLGVTEAGDGQDGRIKSAMGIGSLLEEGIGDTIRVSLTEDSVYEIPAAEEIVKRYNFLSEKTDPISSYSLPEPAQRKTLRP
ncbi:MAG: (E)-4-hydroxy-3-methylbut-2-enyl-diphosphate synthase, partial [Spirochaetia bacterium]|nr:(E)-4-hydroxy-3-methylbut-2-enyl-diphosphate synthase [Spirochaetia bacterium]